MNGLLLADLHHLTKDFLCLSVQVTLVEPKGKLLFRHIRESETLIAEFFLPDLEVGDLGGREAESESPMILRYFVGLFRFQELPFASLARMIQVNDLFRSGFVVESVGGL